MEGSTRLPTTVEARPSSGRGCCGGMFPRFQLSKRQKTLVIVAVSFSVLLLLIVAIVVPITRSESSTTRVVYIAAVQETSWDYAPSGWNDVYDRPLNDYELDYVERRADRIGSTYVKAFFREFTGEDFLTIKEPKSADAHKGLLGPVIRAVVGDKVEVHFLNKLSFPVSLQVTGLSYSSANGGKTFADGHSGNDLAVMPEQQRVYEWEVTEDAGPGIGDPDSIVWTYFSAVDEDKDINSGLIGPIVVTSRGKATSSGAAGDVRQEVFVLAGVVDENRSHYFVENIDKFPDDPAAINVTDHAFYESNRMHSINGFVYGATPNRITIPRNSLVRWYFIGIGDLPHTIRFLGVTLDVAGSRQAYVQVYTGATYSADIRARRTGTFLFEAVGADSKKGMVALYDVV